MGCVRFSLSSNIMGAGHIASRNLSGGTTKIRLSSYLKVIRAEQVSRVESAAQEGGHVRIPGNLYEVLGLSKGATAQEIKRAYRKFARKFHPDAAASAQEKNISAEMFQQICSAYSVLSKPEERAQYDRQLLMQQGLKWNRTPGRGADREPYGHVGRNWETDQCW